MRVEGVWIPFRKRKRRKKGGEIKETKRQGEVEEETWGMMERDED